MKNLFHILYLVYLETVLQTYKSGKIILICNPRKGYKNDMQRCWICPGGQPVTNY